MKEISIKLPDKPRFADQKLDREWRIAVATIKGKVRSGRLLSEHVSLDDDYLHLQQLVAEFNRPGSLTEFRLISKKMKRYRQRQREKAKANPAKAERDQREASRMWDIESPDISRKMHDMRKMLAK